MTQVILDEMIRADTVLPGIQKWTTVCRLVDLRPNEQIYDDRVPTVLRDLKQPTFVTIDDRFWNLGWRDQHYCIIYFAVRSNQQEIIPDLLRRLFQLPEFRTKAKRMGKVMRVSTAGVQYYQLGDQDLHILSLPPERHGRRRQRKT